MGRFLPILMLAAALIACGSSPAGGRGRTDPVAGGGGTGGDPGDGAGGLPPFEPEPPGEPVDLSIVAFEVRTQVWEAHVRPDAEPGFGRVQLVLHERAARCGELDEMQIGPLPHAIVVEVEEPSPGECSRVNAAGGRACRVRAALRIGDGRGVAFDAVPAQEERLRIDRFSDGAMTGELRLSLPVGYEESVGTSSSSEGFRRTCRSAAGRLRECTPATPDEDCCNQGKPLEEVVVPVDATPCATGRVDSGLLLARALVTCPVPEVDCDLACDRLAEVCGVCVDCPPSGCDEVHRACGRSVADCRATCAAASRQPGVSVAAACLAARVGCGGAWVSCLESCAEGTP